MARQVLENGVILPAEYSDDWYDDMTSNLTKLDDVIGSDSEKLSSADVGAAALSNNYNDLDNLPTIPTVNDATLTIQKNGVDVQTFTANASSNVTANITVPTKTSDITNDSNFVDTSNSAVASGITSAKVTSYDSHVADTDIHVTTADKNKWNNGVSQAYVFRYSSTALVASSTNSNTLLDNTDNLKVGDKVIDSDGVLFSITAIDSVNSTFTVGSALIDLALDANVVHTSGNETISGVKTITDTNLEFKSTSAEYGVSAGDSSVIFKDKNNLQTFKIYSRVFSSGLDNNLVSFFLTQKVDNTYYISNGIQLFANTGNKNAILRPILANNNADGLSVSLGASDRRWQSVYANNYYYGSNNVEFSTKFVTTDTNQTISGNKTFEGVDLKLKSVAGEYTVSSGSTSLLFYDKNSLLLSRYSQGVYSGGIPYQTFNIVGYNSNNQQVNKSITFSSSYLDLPTAFLKPDTDNAIALGRNSNKWSDVQTYKINALEPSSLSLPSDRSARIDISSYITNLGNGDNNSYTVPANGYIWLHFTSVNGVLCYSQTSGGLTNYAQTFSRYQGDGQLYAFFPVRKDDKFVVQIYTSSTAVVQNAYFIPCQGNV